MQQQPVKLDDSDLKRSNCKNHPTIPSRFFVLEQPEVRYCKNCALNMALCGRRIEKELTPEEYERKLLIDSIVERLRINAGQVELNQAYYQQLASIIELNAHAVANRIQAVENFMKQLAKVKLELESEYENQLMSKLKTYCDKRDELNNDRLTIVHELENIESNFGSIIDAEGATYFQELKAGWSRVIAKTSKELLSEEQYLRERNKIGESLSAFEQEFREIGKLKVLQLPPCQPFHSKEENKENGQNDIGLNSMKLVEELKLNLTANAQSKVRGTRKMATERQSKQAQKRDKRGCVIEKEMEVAAPARRFNH